MVRRLVLALAIALLVVGCADRPARDMAVPATTTTIAVAGHPRPDLTTGVVLTTSRGSVCTPGWASQHRKSLTAQQKATVLRAYGYPASQKVAEWDHLISLELGGGNGTRNIWPQVNYAEDQRKDRLENRLHDAVCAGRLDLAKAQAEIRQYWNYW